MKYMYITKFAESLFKEFNLLLTDYIDNASFRPHKEIKLRNLSNQLLEEYYDEYRVDTRLKGIKHLHEYTHYILLNIPTSYKDLAKRQLEFGLFFDLKII